MLYGHYHEELCKTCTYNGKFNSQLKFRWTTTGEGDHGGVKPGSLLNRGILVSTQWIYLKCFIDHIAIP